MEIVKIPLSGITRNTDDGVCPDGECMELINARVNNNSVEPVSKPIAVASLPGSYAGIYFHSRSKRYICITEAGTLVSYDDHFSNMKRLSPDVTGVTGIEFVGNIVCAVTSNGMKYFIYRNDDYIYIGEIPDLPDISINKSLDAEIVASDVQLQYSNRSDEDTRKSFYNSAYGYWLKAIKKANERGYFIHSTCIRMAFRMYDGNYTKHSSVRCLFLNDKDKLSVHIPGQRTGVNMDFEGGSFGEFNHWSEKDTQDPQTFHFGAMGFKPSFSYEDFNLSDWKDLIVSVDIFASGSIRHKIRDTEDKTPSVYESLCNESRFYKIASIDLKGNLSYPEMDVSTDYLSLCEQLTDDSNTHDKMIVENSYVYNSRLHIHGIKSILFNGYGKSSIYDNSSGNLGTGRMQVFTYIATGGGYCVLGTTFDMDIPEFITPYFMYPNPNAYKMVLKARYGGVVKSKEVILKKHPSLNMACFINNIKKGGASSGGGRPGSEYYTVDDAALFSIELWDDEDIPVTERNIPDTDNTKLKVSALNNPFYFPPKTTYQFQGEIISVRSNTTALSQGQFGQHPLHVFCKDGTYAMSVGTGGDVVYSSSTPVSRDVCISSYVCGTDSAVAFLTERGAMLISGAAVQCFSEKIDGFLPSCVISSPVILKILGIAGMDGLISSATFRDYITDAKVGYNYQRSEIIIANSSYPYSYVYNMKTGIWYKISLQISNFVNVYPDTYVIVKKDGWSMLYDLNNNHRSVTTMALLTRPIKMGTNSHKRILQTALRGIVKRALSDLYLRGEPVMFRMEGVEIFSDVGFYILGSNDGEHFSLVSGKESIVDIRDLVTKMNKSKAFKYFMVALVGGVRSDVSINYIEMIANESFENRLR